MSRCAGCGHGFENDQLLMQHWIKEGLYTRGKGLRFNPEKPHGKVIIRGPSREIEQVRAQVQEYVSAEEFRGGFRIPTGMIWVLGIVAWFVVLSFDCVT